MAEDQNQTRQEVLPPEALKRFREEIDDACYLLRFAITEGRPGISDSMIDQIIKAQRFSDDNVHPTWSDYTAFTKAYRELSLVLSPINAELLRKQSPLQWLQAQWVSGQYGSLL